MKIQEQTVHAVRTMVIGGGQAGLVMGYYLRRDGDNFVILDATARIGDSWRARYDSLRLFSRPRYASLPGWRIQTDDCPTRDEMADYLEAYARHFELPVRTGVTVHRVSRHGDGFAIDTSAGRILAARVVVAAGMHRRGVCPELASDLDPSIRQLHSLDYRRPCQLAPGGVLVVGAGNSGTDIALEAAANGHRVWLAGRHPGQVPVDIDKPGSRPATAMVMFALKHVLTLRTPMGRKARQAQLGHGVQLVRNKLADLDTAGITRIDRITEVRDGWPVSADGIIPEIATVVWSTGSRPDHSFLDLPLTLADDLLPVHHRGVADAPGLYLIGAFFQFAVASETIQGLDRDARYIARQLRRDRTAAVWQPALVTPG